MIRNEYQRFMQELNEGKAPVSIRKLANIVFDNLDVIQPLGTAQGQRARKIVELSQEFWSTVNAEIMVKQTDVVDVHQNITRLKSLTVGPFRGFSKQEIFDLGSNSILIYGPNGTGKSSFCEALEHGLLGSVAEAESKRFRQQAYLINAHVKQFVPPLIVALNTDGSMMPIAANEAQFRFCFVEKNRIDSFSRIAAQPPAKQTELISTLFGLDDFNEFVRNFTPEIDERYIDILGTKSILLQKKRQVLAGSIQTIKENTDALNDLQSEEVTLASKYSQGMTLQLLIATLGNAESPGEIDALDAEIQQPIATKTGLTATDLQSHKQFIITNQRTLSEKEKALANASESLSYKQLYESVTALSIVGQKECPACKTPITQVTKNPFDLAPRELAKLAHLAQLQQERDQIHINISNAFKQIYQMFQITTSRLGTNDSPNLLKAFLVPQDSEIDLTWWQSLFIVGNDKFTPWQHLHSQVQHLEKMDANIEQAIELKRQKQERLVQLRNWERQITILQTRRKSLEDGIKVANQNIVNFDEANENLIDDVEQEKAAVAINKEIVANYSQFVTRLESYRDALPRQLVADLGETVVELYNAFNRNDAPKDLLAAIRLPVAQGQQIEISFQSKHEQYFDALHILSEGHIRCIGLAILMAKNMKENCPILIFDDPVNAIDDDHRESIRRTIFDDNYFDGKQIILTCHGEEFYKDIQNLLGAERAAQAKTFVFLPQLDEQHIRVDFKSGSRNYILAAQEHIKRLEVREALSKARQALESLTKGEIWRYVHRYGDGNLSLKMHSFNAPIGLRDLTERLKSKISKANFSDQNKDAVLSPLIILLGKNGDSREWRYLNRGTHEESGIAEFDRTAVMEIVAALCGIDIALS